MGGIAATGATLGVYLSSSLLMAVALVIIGSFFFNWFWSLLTLMSQTSVPKESRSASTSLVQTAAFLGAFVGPGSSGSWEEPRRSPCSIAVVVPNALYTVVMVFFYREKPSEDARLDSFGEDVVGDHRPDDPVGPVDYLVDPDVRRDAAEHVRLLGRSGRGSSSGSQSCS